MPNFFLASFRLHFLLLHIHKLFFFAQIFLYLCVDFAFITVKNKREDRFWSIPRSKEATTRTFFRREVQIESKQQQLRIESIFRTQIARSLHPLGVGCRRPTYIVINKNKEFAHVTMKHTRPGTPKLFPVQKLLCDWFDSTWLCRCSSSRLSPSHHSLLVDSRRSIHTPDRSTNMLLLPHIIILAYYDDDRKRDLTWVWVWGLLFVVWKKLPWWRCVTSSSDTRPAAARCVVVSWSENGPVGGFFFLGCRRTIL